MKDIIEVYSDAIISVICAVAVITLFEIGRASCRERV